MLTRCVLAFYVLNKGMIKFFMLLIMCVVRNAKLAAAFGSLACINTPNII
jgi:hypothetical protein